MSTGNSPGLVAGNSYEEIQRERFEQVEMGFTPEVDDEIVLAEWVSILARHVGLAADDGGEFTPERFRRQMRRVAAIAIAAMESFDRINKPVEKPTPNKPEGYEGRKPKDDS